MPGMDVTMDQITTMRSDSLSGCYARPALQRADGTLVCSLHYSPRADAVAQHYITIDAAGEIGRDTVWRGPTRGFVAGGGF